MAWREEEEKKNEWKTVLHEGWMVKSAVFIMLMVIDYWFTLVWCYMAGTHVLELLISMGMDCN